MATPQMLIQTVNATLTFNSPGSIRVNTFNPNGTVLNVSSGYTVATFEFLPSGNANLLNSSPDLTSHMTAAFDATGVTLSFTAAQNLTMLGLLPTNQMKGYLRLSNDSGATQSVAAIVNLSIDQSSTDS